MPPLSGVCFASTGIDNRKIDAIHRAVKGLGGEFLSNLSEKPITFLIVGQRWSEKYNFCAANCPETIFITPETLLETQESYTRGDALDPLAHLRANAMTPFGGLKITASSLSIDKERQVATMVAQYGGTFTRTLNRDCDLVIAEHCQGKRAKFAAQWEKPIVIPSWIDACIKRGAAMPLAAYFTDKAAARISKPVAPVVAPVAKVAEAPPTGPVPTETSIDSFPQKLNFRLGPKRKPAEYDDLFVPKTAKIPGAARQSSKSTRDDSIMESSSGILAGYSFGMHGFGPRERGILYKTIASHEGTLEAPYDFMIVNSKRPQIPEGVGRARVITEWAIERSLYKKAAILTDLWGTPVYHQDISGLRGLKICLSGFTGVELVHMERLVTQLGATLEPSLTVDRDILVAHGPDCQKFGYAKVWRVPVVSKEWLWDCAKHGEALDISREHALDGLGPRPVPKRLQEVAPAAELADIEPTKETDHVQYGSDDDEDAENRMPVGRDFVEKTVPKRRSKRHVD